MSFPNPSYSGTPPKSSFTSPFSGTGGQPDAQDGQAKQRHQARLQNRASRAQLLDHQDYEEEEDFENTLPFDQAHLVDALLYQLNSLKPPLANKRAELVRFFATIKSDDKNFKVLLRSYAHTEKVQVLQQRLTQLTHHLLTALRSEDTSVLLDIQPFQQTDIQTLCQGLTLCVPVSGPGLFTKNKSNCKLLQALTSTLLERALQLGLPEGVAENGQVLDILNWVSHGLKAKLLHGDDTITKVFTRSLVLLESWSEGDHSRQLISDHNVGKCAVQIQVMYNEKLVDLHWKNTEGEGLDNLNRLKQCVLNFCTPETLHHLIKSGDTVSLLNICNTIKDFIKGGLLTKADAGLLPALRELVTFIGKVPDEKLIGYFSDCQKLSNFSNFLRTLAEQKSNQQPLFTSELPQFDATCAKLVACINSKAFEEAEPDSQALSNLVSFIKLCGKRLAPDSKPDVQTPLINAAACLTELVMAYGPGAYQEPRAMTGLLAGLAYLWERNLIVRSDTVKGFMQQIVAQAGNLSAPNWTDESRKIVLPHLQMLFKENVFVLTQMQPALRHILGIQGEVTLATLIANSKRLGAVTDVVVSLPLLTKTPEKETIAPVADKPAEKVIPGQTHLRAENAGTTMDSTNSPLAIPASSSTTYRGPVQEAPRKPASKVQEIKTSPAPTYHSEPVVSVRPAAVIPSQKRPQPKVTAAASSKPQVMPAEKKLPTVKNNSPAKPVQVRQKQTATSSSIHSKKSAATMDKQGRQSEMLAALLQGKPDIVGKLMAKSGHWSDTEIHSLLNVFFADIELIDNKIVTAFDQFVQALLDKQGKAVIPVLSNYFEMDPPKFSGINQKLIAHQIIRQAPTKIEQRPEIKFDTKNISNEWASALVAITSAMPKKNMSSKLDNATIKKILDSLLQEIRTLRTDIFTPLMDQNLVIELSKSIRKNGWNTAMPTGEEGHIHIVAALIYLMMLETRMEIIERGWNVLMLASHKNHEGIVDCILHLKEHFGKHVTALNPDGLNALMLACEGGHSGIVAALLKLDSRNEQVKPTNKEGCNALMLAIKNGHTNIAALLLGLESANVQAQAIDKNGLNALQLAIQHNQTEIVSLLKKLDSLN